MAIGFPLTSNRTIIDDLVGVIRRRKTVVLITTLVTTLIVYLGLLFVPENYEATALLQVMLGRENSEVPAAVQKGSVYPSGVQREEINSDIQLLKSHELIESMVDVMGVEPFRFDSPPPKTLYQYIKYATRAVKDWTRDIFVNGLIMVGLKKELTEREKTIVYLASSLDAEKEGDSNVIRVSLRLPDREIAIKALATIVECYFERRASLHTTDKVLSILEAQVSNDRVDFESLQRQRQQIKQKWEVSSIEHQRAELLQRLHKVLYGMDERRSELAGAEAYRAVVANRSAVTPIIEQDAKISSLQAAIKQDETNRQAIEHTLMGLNEAGELLQAMDVQIDAAEKHLTSDMARRDAARVDRELDRNKVVNVTVISDVAASPDSVSPNKLRFVGFGILGGMILGITVGTLLEWGDDTIHGQGELLGLPNLPFLGEFHLGQLRSTDEGEYPTGVIDEIRHGSGSPSIGNKV